MHTRFAQKLINKVVNLSSSLISAGLEFFQLSSAKNVFPKYSPATGLRCAGSEVGGHGGRSGSVYPVLTPGLYTAHRVSPGGQTTALFSGEAQFMVTSDITEEVNPMFSVSNDSDSVSDHEHEVKHNIK